MVYLYHTLRICQLGYFAYVNFILVPPAGIEPALAFSANRILSPACLPIPPQGQAHCVQAVREGFEPSCCNSISNTLPAGWWSTPYYLSVLFFSALETGGCVCHTKGISPPDNLLKYPIFFFFSILFILSYPSKTYVYCH